MRRQGLATLSIDFRCATASIQVGIGQARGLLFVEFYELLEVFRNPRVLINCLNRALSFAGAAVDAFIRVYHEHAIVIVLGIFFKLLVIFLLFDVVKTINRANLNARAILGAQTINSNNVSHFLISEKNRLFFKFS